MNGQQEAPLSNGDYGLSRITKEDVKIQDIVQSGTFEKTGDHIEQLVVEPLDLTLPKKDKDNKEKCKWVLDPAYAASLIMEVDEIEDDTQHLEMEQYEDSEPVPIHFQNWDQHPSVLNVTMSPDPQDTLLIDDEGIPYTLTPDGQKVPQIETSVASLTNLEDINGGSLQLDYETYLSPQGSDLDPEVPLANLSPSSSTEITQNIKMENPSPDESTLDALSTALPDLSSLTSLPVQIMASNTGSNTPILLLPQSQLQTLTSSATTANPSILSLSLPLALGQNGESNNVLLLLSSAQVSSGIPSTLVSSSSGLLDAKPEPSSCTTSSLSGKTQPYIYSSSPASPTTSSNNSPKLTKQQKLDTCSDMPTSFREALLRLAASAEQKKENQPRCVDKPSAMPSCTEASQAPEEHCNNEQVSPASDQTSLSLDQTVDPLSINLSSKDDLPLQSSTSPVSPESPALPPSNPQSQDPETLEPRRILYCQYCPRIFYYLSDLERHSITHSQTKPHVCLVCGKAFKRSSHLARHKHIHTGERNFECQLCPRRFREAAELTRHQRVHTGEKPYQCLLCHMRFAERNTLRRHTKRKHQGQQQGVVKQVKPGPEGVYLAGMPEQQEENAEWYSSALTEIESDNDTGGE